MADVTVYRTWEEPMADMCVGLLRAEGLSPLKITDIVRSLHPFTVDGLGEIEIRVSEEEQERAEEIIAARFSDAGEGAVSGD